MENPYAQTDDNPRMNQTGPGYDNFQPKPLPPDNYLIWAILSTICCCLPLGVVSIVYAAQVNGLYRGGDYAGAVMAERNAKRWIIANLAVTVAIYVVYFFVIVLRFILIAG